MSGEYDVVGKSVPRRDLPEKLTGAARYTADVKLPGMLHGRILRSPHAHARVLSVDVSRAEQLPGVYALLTPFDAPEGRIAPDLPILDMEVRFVGDEVAAVAAEDEDVWPSPALKEKLPPDTAKAVPMSDFLKSGLKQYPDVLNPIWDEVNKKYGTDLKPGQ